MNLRDIAEDTVTGDVLFSVGLAPAPPEDIAVVSKAIVWKANSEPDFRNYTPVVYAAAYPALMGAGVLMFGGGVLLGRLWIGKLKP